ncbi:MAG: hypothetical protein CBC47_07300 [Alphaproteobacteria bacterium TMED87]|nr:hypothetical protein [Rhodospirillaceae bacterium]OUV08494.1 MAG: hypothetical protein CBC47_07300 [Alphaproteobacteria bacterium TMED87]|tara:strand:- start:549 stop:830 length:282 start_codon:yes stop_codon:yes gene_type:complete
MKEGELLIINIFNYYDLCVDDVLKFAKRNTSDVYKHVATIKTCIKTVGPYKYRIPAERQKTTDQVMESKHIIWNLTILDRLRRGFCSGSITNL